VTRPSKRVLISCSAALLSVAVGATIMSFAAIASTPTGGVGLRPAHPHAANPNYFALHVARGETIHRWMVVTNSAHKAVSLTIYPVDGRTGPTTGTVFSGHRNRLLGAGQWITPSVRTLKVQAGESRRLEFSVKVPKTAAPGDHVGGIAARTRNITTPKPKPKHGGAVNEVVRTVIAVEIVVPGKAVFRPSLTTLAIRRVGPTAIGAVYVGLGDRGRRMGSPRLAVTLTRLHHHGLRIVRRLDTVLPGALVTYPLIWPAALAPGRYRISARLSLGSRHVSLHRTVTVHHRLAGAHLRRQYLR
jgi:hypothetical protein